MVAGTDKQTSAVNGIINSASVLLSLSLGGVIHDYFFLLILI